MDAYKIYYTIDVFKKKKQIYGTVAYLEVVAFGAITKHDALNWEEILNFGWSIKIKSLKKLTRKKKTKNCFMGMTNLIFLNCDILFFPFQFAKII